MRVSHGNRLSSGIAHWELLQLEAQAFSNFHSCCRVRDMADTDKVQVNSQSHSTILHVLIILCEACLVLMT